MKNMDGLEEAIERGNKAGERMKDLEGAEYMDALQVFLEEADNISEEITAKQRIDKEDPENPCDEEFMEDISS